MRNRQDNPIALVAVIFILMGQAVFAQSGIDTSYIESYPQKMRIRTFVATNSIEIEDFSPNYPLNVGIGFALKNTVLNLRFGYGLLPLKGDKFGKTKVFDLQMHKYGRHFVLDLFVQRYKGFFHDNSKGQVEELYPDLSILQMGAEVSYLFNGNKFSAKAAFDQSEIQIRSEGSLVAGMGTYFYRLNNVPAWGSNNSVENLQMAFNGGYAYSWVIDERWLWSGMATLGANFGNEIKALEDGKLKVSPAASARTAGAYHKSDWSVCLSMLIQNKSVYSVENERLGVTTLNFELAYIKQLDHIFQKKKKW